MQFDDDDLRSKLNKIGDLAKLAIEDERGNPALQFGFVLKLYFKHACEKAVREQMICLIEDYSIALSSYITHYMPYEGLRLKSTKEFDYISYFRDRINRLQSEKDVEGFDAELYGFPDVVDRDEPTACHIGVVASRAIDKKRMGNTDNALGHLEAYFPADWQDCNYSFYLELLMRWAKIGQPIHGSFGLGLVMEEGCGRGPFMPLAFPFLKRFVGLEYPDLGRWRTMSEDAKSLVIRSTNWLTLIDTPRAKMVGGERTIKSDIEPLCSVHPYDGGLIIQAGEEPKLGDSNKGEIAEPYRVVARALKPLRFEDFGRKGIFNGLPSPLIDRDETLRWLRRFD